MTRHDERQLVRRTGLGDGAHGLGLTEGDGDFGVAGGLAQRDFLQCPPDPRLERSAPDVERQVEVLIGCGDKAHDPVGPALEPGILGDHRSRGEALP